MSKRTFRVKKGSHFAGNREYKEGDSITSSQDLLRIFPNKFEEVLTQVVVKETPPEEETDTEENEDDQQEESSDQSFGEDVTAEFPSAKKNKLSVFKRGSRYHVVDPTEDDKKTIKNGEGLKKSQVKQVILDYISS